MNMTDSQPITFVIVAKIGKLPAGARVSAEAIRAMMADRHKEMLVAKPNCMGSAFRIAHKLGLISVSSYGIAKRDEAHGRLTRVWVRNAKG
jgi:hypothetical protein